MGRFPLVVTLAPALFRTFAREAENGYARPALLRRTRSDEMFGGRLFRRAACDETILNCGAMDQPPVLARRHETPAMELRRPGGRRPGRMVRLVPEVASLMA